MILVPEPDRELRLKVVDALDRVRGCSSDEELVYIEVRRNEECHATLDRYVASVSERDDWRHTTFKIVGGRPMDIDEALAECDAIEKAHGGAELAACDFARRARIHVANVHVPFVI